MCRGAGTPTHPHRSWGSVSVPLLRVHGSDVRRAVLMLVCWPSSQLQWGSFEALLRKNFQSEWVH